MFINNLAYEASAGSGKTFMLVVRYLSLLFRGADPSKILALTFTNKAAAEMQERIIATLDELENRDELNEIVKVSAITKAEILKQRAKVLHQFLNSDVKIMTIDKFFTTILRKFSLYTSLMPNFTTSAAQHEIKLLERFLQEIEVANKKRDFIDLALEFNKRFSDIFLILEQLYMKKDEFQNLQFTKQNYHHYKEMILKEFYALQKIVFDCKVASKTAKSGMSIEDFEDILHKSWISRESLEYRTFAKCYQPQMDEHLHTIQKLLKEYMQAKESSFFYELMQFVEIYQRAKKALYMKDSELSFNDVTILVHYLLQKRVDSEFLYFRLDATIEHILLDEFQDTSIIQYKILKPLIDEIVSGNGLFEDASFFFVGDKKQSIYRFRGGVSALFDVVAQEQHTQVEKLLTNYRSKEMVISFVNDTFKNKIKNYTPQKVREEAQGGYVEVLETSNPLEETLLWIEKLLNNGARADDIAILCATNGDGEVIKNLLVEKGIEVVTETTTKLIHQKSVMAVLEYLKYLYFNEKIYKHNFFALINKEVDEIFKIDLQYYSLSAIVKIIIEKYQLFFDEFHLIRFLDVVESYKDVESLLFEYERLDTPAAATDLKGIRVLTIHKSKGLEYEHVVVMDRLKNPPPSRESIIFEYENITLKNIYLRMKNRDALDSRYKEALLKEKILSYEDNLNAMYVAFTRAKQNLIIVQKEQKSIFEQLDLKVGFLGSFRVEQKKNEQSFRPKPFFYKEKKYGVQNEVILKEKEQSLDFQAQNFGTALHYMLEMLEEFNPQSIAQAKDATFMKFGNILTQEDFIEIQKRVELLLQNKEFLNLLGDSYTKEQPIQKGKKLYYIDLLIWHEKYSIVIDYKTSLLDEQEHKKQVKNYITLVQEATKKEVRGYLCYLLEDRVELKKV